MDGLSFHGANLSARVNKIRYNNDTVIKFTGRLTDKIAARKWLKYSNSRGVVWDEAMGEIPKSSQIST